MTKAEFKGLDKGDTVGDSIGVIWNCTAQLPRDGDGNLVRRLEPTVPCPGYYKEGDFTWVDNRGDGQPGVVDATGKPQEHFNHPDAKVYVQ